MTTTKSAVRSLSPYRFVIVQLCLTGKSITLCIYGCLHSHFGINWPLLAYMWLANRWQPRNLQKMINSKNSQWSHFLFVYSISPKAIQARFNFIFGYLSVYIYANILQEFSHAGDTVRFPVLLSCVFGLTA